MAIACQNLRRKRVGRKTQLSTDVLLYEWVDAGIGSNSTADCARCCNLASLLQTRLGALQGPSPAAELHAERHGLSMDAMGAAHAQGFLELESATLAGFTQQGDVLQNDVQRLGNLIGKSRIAQVGRSHTVMNPTARRLGSLGNVGINVLRHVGGEGDYIVVGNLFDLVNALNGEVCMLADPSSLFLGDARFAQLGLGFACQNLDFLPDLELVLELPNSTHFGAGVATDHSIPPFTYALPGN